MNYLKKTIQRLKIIFSKPNNSLSQSQHLGNIKHIEKYLELQSIQTFQFYTKFKILIKKDIDCLNKLLKN